MVSPQVCKRPDRPSTLLSRGPSAFGTLLGRIFSRLPGFTFFGRNHGPEVVPSILPDEILIKVVSYCVRPFSLSIRMCYLNASQNFEYSTQDSTYQHIEHYYVDGLWELDNIKLVSCLFYDAVWAEVAKEFDGCLELHLPYADKEEAITRINQLLSVPILKLSWLSQQITHLRLLSQTSSDILPDLDLKNLPKLERVHLDRILWPSDAHTYTRELCREPGDELDRQVVLNFEAQARYDHKLLATLNALKQSPMKIFMEYSIQEAGYGDITMYLFQLDVTDYPDVAVTKRTEMPIYYPERLERA